MHGSLTKLLGLDVGTTGVRCVAVDERGQLLADATEEYPLYSPHPGWSEQRPEDWWAASRNVISRVTARIGPDVGGIGLAGQMHGAVFLDDRLTGEKATDASDAAGTLLLDLKARTWSSEILEALEISARWLPQVFESPDRTGSVLKKVAKELGLPDGVPVAAGAGDNAAAAVGNGIVREGLASCSIGTSGVLFAHSDTMATDPSGRVHAFCHAVPLRYHLMGVTLAAGGALRWWRDLVG